MIVCCVIGGWQGWGAIWGLAGAVGEVRGGWTHTIRADEKYRDTH